MDSTGMNKVTIADFASEYRDYFRSLNYAWIDEILGVTQEDERILANPEDEIINSGGAILFALSDDKVIGTCALIKHSETDYELAKMAVDKSARGLGAGFALGEAIIERSRRLKAKRLFLFTHHELQAAQKLYKRLGFVDVKIEENRVCGREQCTIAMELRLI